MKKSTQIAIIAIVVSALIAVPTLYYFVYLPTIPSPLKKVKLLMGLPPEQGNWEWIYADYAGIYEEEGIEMEITPTRGSHTEVLQAFLAGESDFLLGGEDCIRARLMGVSVKVVLLTGRIPWGLWARPGIESIQDVKSIAVGHGRGTGGHILVTEYLLRHGIKPEDVSIRFMDMAALAPALLEGQVDAAVVSARIGLEALRSGYKLLFGGAEEFPDYYAGGLSATEKTIAEKPEVVKAMVKALYRSLVFLMEHKEEAIEYAVNVLKLDPEFATFLYEWHYEGKHIGEVRIKPDIPVEGIEYTMKMLAKYNDLEEIPVEQCIDTSFIKQVKKELGVS